MKRTSENRNLPFDEVTKTTIIEIFQSNLSGGKKLTQKDFIRMGYCRNKFTKTFGNYDQFILEYGGIEKWTSETRSCKICNTLFDTTSDNKDKTYCSRSCTNKATKYRPELHTNCKNCDKTFKFVSSDTCSFLCRIEYTSKFIKVQDVITQNDANKFDRIRGRARAYSKHIYKRECMNCGYDKTIEVCHKKPIASFPMDA